MLAKIKNIEVWTEVENIFCFTPEMYSEGVFQFSPIRISALENSEDWWQVVNVSNIQGFVYHISWLDPVESV